MAPPLKKTASSKLFHSPLYKKFQAVFRASIAAEDMKYFDAATIEFILKSHWDLCRKHMADKGAAIHIDALPPSSMHTGKTAVSTVNDDMAFLVDSVAAEINRAGYLIESLIHPLFYVRYDKTGTLIDIADKPQKGYLLQSHIFVQINRRLSEGKRAKLKASIAQSIDDVYKSNRDWREMLQAMQSAREELMLANIKAPRADIERYCAFLDYLHNNNFTFLGYREYEFIETKDSLKSRTINIRNLGILKDEGRAAYISESKEGLPRNLQELRRSLPPVSVSKTNALARVHRTVPMDAIAIKTYDRNGKVVGEKLFLGLFTSVTYSRSVSDVPYLREKVEGVMAMSRFLPGSHNRKALRHILEKYPRDELFQIASQDLFKIGLNILRLQERQRIALFLRHDAFGRYISCLVYVPRDRFGTTIRKKIQFILEHELGGTCSNFTTTVDDSVFARVMYTIKVSQSSAAKYNVERIESLLQEAGQLWPEKLDQALIEEAPEEKAEEEQKTSELSHRYAEAFSPGYAAHYTPKQAVSDINKIEAARASGRLTLELFRLPEMEARQLRLKIYNPGAPLDLSDVLPILAHMGLRAIEELPFEVKPGGDQQAFWIQDFLLESPKTQDPVNLKDAKADFEEAFAKIWYCEAESDELNRLILTGAMTWHEIIILRAYVRYMRQLRTPFSLAYIQTALTDKPRISQLFVQYFKLRHDPARGKDADKLADGCIQAVEKELQGVESLDQDRILRSLLNIMQSTLRTNYFQKDEQGNRKPWLSIKIDSKRVEDMPEPKPYREIFVYSPRVEAIHLRGDVIARGGLRWSDRAEDYRTEVLGLMKAQMVKNAVIVPMGSKGGFFVKTPTASRAAFMSEGIECYRIFIRGLLDITDNRKDAKIVPPRDVVRHDGDDPYLVVAADKGTATFSDIANAISLEYGFWLGDAFASGGSAGYDHKQMGITAKGAWESIKLHFRQMGADIQKKPFDVVGVGDMGGDVFGNGMILSSQIRLIGAFNHVHIFCDPNPDPAASFAERKRLFTNVLGWDQYDVKKLSPGGRIFLRTEKLLQLTPEIRKAFDIEKDSVTPPDLIRAMLKARADLLWFGGIGTYIKSSKETHADVIDKANDALRIDGADIRAKVVGEGANMAVTQRGRIEYALRGGRINTDFLDNSAGVDTSDHEVNIKILLNELVARAQGGLMLKARNKLLADMTNEVGAHVLRDNYQQAQAISLAEYRAAENLELHEELIQDLERGGVLTRALEALPATEDVLARKRNGLGLTRPELCTLLAYSKIVFSRQLLGTGIPDEPDMQIWVTNYFPQALRQKFAGPIAAHRLRREIIATALANSLVNRMGPGFIMAISQKTGAGPDAIAKAYIIVRGIFGLRQYWDAIEALDNHVLSDIQLQAMTEVAGMAAHAMAWFLTRKGQTLDLGSSMRDYGEGIEILRKNIARILPADMKEHVKTYAQALIGDGLPKALADSIATMPVMASACDMIRIAKLRKIDLLDTAKVYFAIGRDLNFDWLRQKARHIKAADYWQKEAISNLIARLYDCQAAITVHVLSQKNLKTTQREQALQMWKDGLGQKYKSIDAFLGELRAALEFDLSMLVVAEQHLHSLCAD